MKSSPEPIDLALRERGVRVTGARRIVYRILLEAPAPLSASEVDQALSGSERSIDLVTVYRTLETLEKCGLVTRIDRLAQGWRYAPRAKDHSHQITCSRCGASSPLEHCDLERLEKSLERVTGFADIHHSLQFYGTCPGCQ